MCIRDRHDACHIPLNAVADDLIADRIDVEFDLRNDDMLRSARDARVKRDIPAFIPHDFNDAHALMGIHRIADTRHFPDDAVDRRVETNGEIRICLLYTSDSN